MFDTKPSDEFGLCPCCRGAFETCFCQFADHETSGPAGRCTVHAPAPRCLKPGAPRDHYCANFDDGVDMACRHACLFMQRPTVRHAD